MLIVNYFLFLALGFEINVKQLKNNFNAVQSMV